MVTCAAMTLATKLRKRFVFMGRLRPERSADDWVPLIIVRLAQLCNLHTGMCCHPADCCEVHTHPRFPPNRLWPDRIGNEKSLSWIVLLISSAARRAFVGDAVRGKLARTPGAGLRGRGEAMLGSSAAAKPRPPAPTCTAGQYALTAIPPESRARRPEACAPWRPGPAS